MKRSYGLRLKLILLLTLCIITTCKLSISQEKIEENNSEKSIIITFLPQYVAINGLRVDLDIPLRRNKSYIILSPQFYLGTNGSIFFGNEYNRMNGFGLNMQHRVFIKENIEGPKGWYIMWGPTYQHFNLYVDSYQLTDYPEYGSYYMTFAEGEANHPINKFGLDISMGRQWIIGKTFVLDGYTGVGIRMAYDKDWEMSVKDGNPFGSDIPFEYGFSGTTLVIGLRIGIMP